MVDILDQPRLGNSRQANIKKVIETVSDSIGYI